MKKLLKISTALAVTATAATAVCASAAVASAATQSPASAPVRHAGVWMPYQGGQYWMGSDVAVEHGRKVIVDCVIPGAALLTPTSVRTGTYGTARQSGELGYVLSHWAASPQGSTAAGARLAMLDILGRKIPGLKVPAGIARLAASDIRTASLYAGPYRAAVKFESKPATPRQTGTFRVTAVSASGHTVSGLPVRVSASGAKAAVSGRTGTAVKFTRTGTGPVHVSASAESPTDKVTIGTAAHGQTLLAAAAPVQVTASAAYQASPVPVKARVTCNCDGTGNVTGTIHQAAGSAKGRYTLSVNGRTVSTVTVAGSRSAETASIKGAGVADGAKVTFTAQYLVGGRWTAPVSLGSFTVICAATPHISVKCNKATLTIAGEKLPAGYTEKLFYSMDGKTTAVSVPASGKTVTFTDPDQAKITYYGEVLHNGEAVTETPQGTWS